MRRFRITPVILIAALLIGVGPPPAIALGAYEVLGAQNQPAGCDPAAPHGSGAVANHMDNGIRGVGPPAPLPAMAFVGFVRERASQPPVLAVRDMRELFAGVYHAGGV